MPDSAAYWVYRLDAAVMLALVFLSEAPDVRLGRAAVDRVREVHGAWRRGGLGRRMAR